MVLTIKLVTSVSFRAAGKQAIIQQRFIDSLDEAPRHTTIMNWVLKIGCYELTKPKPKADDWVIILDHSIQIGTEKVFVVLGIKESSIQFDRPLQYKDLTPLIITSRKKWNGEDVAEHLRCLEDEIGKIKYAVGDYGSNIKKGLRLRKITHIHDVTHWMALLVEKLYKKDTQYELFCLKLSEMRNKLYQSEIAHIIPPKQRNKSFYQNIKTISDWAIKSLQLADNQSEKTKTFKKEKENLVWLRDFRDLINELNRINQTICEIEKVIKTNGLSNQTIKTCNAILNQSKLDSSEKGKSVKQKTLNYMIEILQLIPNAKSLICTSDILESAFGKYKNYVSSNQMACVTNLILCIAAFTSSLTEEAIVIALEKTKMKDVKEWTKKNIGDSVLKKRTVMLSAA